MSYLNDIEDFTTDELRKEIHRRVQATFNGMCWYCKQHIEVHTCKHAIKETPIPGWYVQPARFVRTEDCMDREEEYWQVCAQHPVLGLHRCGNADTKEEALAKCIEHCKIAESKSKKPV